MISFKNLLDNNLYTNIKIYNILNNENAILAYYGYNKNSLIDFLNSSILNHNEFKNYYEKTIVKKNKLKIFLNIGKNSTFNYINKKLKNKLINKQKLNEFKGENVIINVTNENNLKVYNNFNEILEDFFNSQVNMSIRKKYKNFIFIIDIDNNLKFNEVINNTKKSTIGFLYKFLESNNKLKISNLNFYCMINNTSKNSFIKFPLNNKFLSSNNIKLIENIQKLIINDKDENINTYEKELKYLEKVNKDDDKSEKVIDSIFSKLLINEKELSKNQKNLVSNISNKIRMKFSSDEFSKYDVNMMIQDIEDDKEIMKDIDFLKDTIKTGKETEIIENLKKQQDNINLDDLNFKDIFSEMSSVITDETLNINAINDEIKKVSQVKVFDDKYMSEQFEKDLFNVLESFNDDVDIPTFITDIQTEDSSTVLDKKNTMKIKMKDANNKTHNIKVDIPKIVDGKYIIVNGSKKIIQKQLTLKPIVKTKSDTVQITTNYNKLFITRFGQKKSAKLNILKKIFTGIDLNKYKKNKNIFNFKFGNTIDKNSKYLTSLEYIDISSYLSSFNTSEFTLYFDQSELENHINSNENLSKLKYDSKEYFPIGFNNDNNKLIVCSLKDYSIYILLDKFDLISGSISSLLLETVLDNCKENIYEAIKTTIESNQSLCYSRIEINNKKVPVIIILCYEIGLRNVLERYHIDYEFTTSNKSIKLSENKNKIRFKNGYLIYDVSKIRNSILLSGLNLLDTKSINFEELEKKDVFLDLFYELFKSRNAAKGFHNTISLLIDPITKEVLNDLKLPNNIIDLLLYANTLLEDISFKSLNDMSIYRIRGAEQVNACLYQLLSNSFKNYKDTSHARNPVTMSIPQDALIKKLVEMPTVDEFSELNPTLEMEKMNSVTYKGVAGLNVDEAYTEEIRGFDKSMEGILAINTPDSDKVGVVRELTLNSSITNTRGYLNLEKELNKNTDLYSPGELMNVFTTTHADPPRIGMMVTQQKHIVPTKKQDSLLVGSGMEKAVPYTIGNTFAFKAKEKGKVKTIDEKNKLVLLEYSNGTEDIIDMDNHTIKNSNGGFYVNQKLDLLFKEGQSFKKGDIIAKNSAFFNGNKQGEINYTFGKLCKIAIASGDFTYEDSSIITESLSKDMSTKVTMRKALALDVNANIDYIVKEGQKIKTGEPLCIFEKSFEDKSINDLLDKIGSELGEEISDISKNSIHSKYTGGIAKINIYYNREISEFTPSVQKILKDYIKSYQNKLKIINSNKAFRDSSNITLPPVEKINGNKIKGEDIDGILIEFFIEYEDELSVGDKISFYTSLKTIICDIIKKGEEPISEYHKDEIIEAILSPISIAGRQTADIYYAMFSNKALIELKRQIKEIYNK